MDTVTNEGWVNEDPVADIYSKLEQAALYKGVITCPRAREFPLEVIRAGMICLSHWRVGARFEGGPVGLPPKKHTRRKARISPKQAVL